MSGSGTKRKCRHVSLMSAIGGKADVLRTSAEVRVGPDSDIASQSHLFRSAIVAATLCPKALKVMSWRLPLYERSVPFCFRRRKAEFGLEVQPIHGVTLEAASDSTLEFFMPFALVR